MLILANIWSNTAVLSLFPTTEYMILRITFKISNLITYYCVLFRKVDSI